MNPSPGDRLVERLKAGDGIGEVQAAMAGAALHAIRPHRELGGKLPVPASPAT
jgi:hypothetical protein